MNETKIKEAIETYFKEMSEMKTITITDWKQKIIKNGCSEFSDEQTEIFHKYIKDFDKLIMKGVPTALFALMKSSLLQTIFDAYGKTKDWYHDNWLTVITKYPSFFTDPASVKYHGNYTGGLFDHSIQVFYNCLKTRQSYGIKADEINPYAIIFHDLCKCGSYQYDMKAIGDNYCRLTDESALNPFAVNKFIEETNTVVFRYDNSNEGIQHGPESLRRLLITFSMDVAFVERIIPEAWQFVIAYHMGPYDCSPNEQNAFGKMCEKHPEVLMLHQADMIASKIQKM